jgi:hypothetical protein
MREQEYIYWSDNYMTLIYTDDLVPRVVDAGAVEVVTKWATGNCPSEVLTYLVAHTANMPALIWDQLKQILADCLLARSIEGLSLYGDALPNAIDRSDAPGSLGMNSNNIWFESGPYAVGKTFRCYLNGVLKQTIVGENMFDRANVVGGVPGDIIQICEVKDGIVGWWSRITVPA